MTDMHIVFIILAATTICFAIPKFRADLVALTSLLALFLTGLITVPEALAGFSSTVVIMLAVLFIVGEGIAQTGLAGKAGNLLVKLTGNSEFRMLIFVKLLVAVIGSFISNTGTVAILMPVVVSLATRMNIHPGKLLMPLAFGASMGGALTLIGTAPNLLARDALIKAGLDGLSFFDFTPIGLIILVVGTTYMWFIGRKMLDKPYEKKSNLADTVNVSELLNQYKVDEYLHFIQVPESHEIVGKTLKELKWPGNYNVSVLKVRKKEAPKALQILSAGGGYTQELAQPSMILEAEDVLLLLAENDALQNLLAETGLQTMRRDEVEELQIQNANIAEVILTPQSSLINQTLKDIQFRDKYSLSVLSVKCPNQNAKQPSAYNKIAYGDALLVYGKWKDIDRLAKEKRDMVVIAHETSPQTAFNPVRAMSAAAVLLAMVVLLVGEWIPAVITVIIAGLAMVLTGSIRSTEQAYRSVNWSIVILIACMLPMATALENTGGVAFIADSITSALGDAGPMVVMAGLYITTSLFGVFISNTATAVLFLPVAILAAQEIGVSPVPFVMAVTYAASMSFATPVSTPPNAMVMVAGKYKFVDYMKVGIPLQFIVGFAIIFLLPLFFPLYI